MWWQLILAFWLAFQVGFLAACFLSAAPRPVLVRVHDVNRGWNRE